MSPKEGTKIELQREICQILSDLLELQVQIRQICQICQFPRFRKNRQTDRKTKTDRQSQTDNRQTDTDRHTQSDRQIDRQTNRHRQIDRQTNRQTERHTNGQWGWQSDQKACAPCNRESNGGYEQGSPK